VPGKGNGARAQCGKGALSGLGAGAACGLPTHNVNGCQGQGHKQPNTNTTLSITSISCPATSRPCKTMSSSSSSFLDTHRSRPAPNMPSRLLSSLKRPFSKPKHDPYPSILVCLPSHSSPLSIPRTDPYIPMSLSPTGPANRTQARPHRATSRSPWVYTSRVRLTYQLTSRTYTPLPCSRGCSVPHHHPPPHLNVLTGPAPAPFRPTCPPGLSPNPGPTPPHPRDPPLAHICPSHHHRHAQP